MISLMISTAAARTASGTFPASRARRARQSKELKLVNHDNTLDTRVAGKRNFKAWPLGFVVMGAKKPDRKHH